MERAIAELVALAGPAYFFLQLITAFRYSGLWRLAALVPLLLMAPLAIHAGLAYADGAQGWPVLASPAAFVYLLLVVVAKGALGSLRQRNGRAHPSHRL